MRSPPRGCTAHNPGVASESHNPHNVYISQVHIVDDIEVLYVVHVRNINWLVLYLHKPPLLAKASSLLAKASRGGLRSGWCPARWQTTPAAQGAETGAVARSEAGCGALVEEAEEASGLGRSPQLSFQEE